MFIKKDSAPESIEKTISSLLFEIVFILDFLKEVEFSIFFFVNVFL